VKLNWIETLLMNNPVRARVQRRREAPGLVALATRGVEDAETLIIGCGRGVDIEVALDQLHVRRVTAIDLDERQVARARRRLGGVYKDRLTLGVCDATKMPFAEESFDAVLDFGIVHHIPRWQEAIGEVHRVLRRGGQFLFEEIRSTSSTARSTASSPTIPERTGSTPSTSVRSASEGGSRSETGWRTSASTVSGPSVVWA